MQLAVRQRQLVQLLAELRARAGADMVEREQASKEASGGES